MELKSVWVILANSSQSTIYAVSKKLKFKFIKKLLHQEGRLKNKELVSDRPGHYQKGKNCIRGSYSEKMNHKILEKERFSKEIILELENGYFKNLFIGIIFISEPDFYGILNHNLPSNIRNLIKTHILKDYTYYNEKELLSELKNNLAHEIRLIFLSQK